MRFVWSDIFTWSPIEMPNKFLYWYTMQNVLESGTKKSNSCQTMSLFLSKQLAKHRHGLEYGALAVKDYLERLFFSDIVSTTMIMWAYITQVFLLSFPLFFTDFEHNHNLLYNRNWCTWVISFSPENYNQNLGPWVCHFHIRKVTG